ncbi:unnamed protein product [Rhizoctonia solani]|uniref:Uncharacterized protein n=1 Tax=Rhizoctonia solani TaxID=456999 RepID=A0A8H3D6C0_9AGAM|nr:unnamed protein product [Rhizoctonia solani]
MARNTSIRQNQHSQTVPWGNQEDPSNRDESQGRRFGRWQAQLKQASELFEAEEEIGSLKQQLQERDTEIQCLQASRNGDAAHASAQPDGNRSTPTAELVAALSTYSIAEGIVVRATGRRCAALHMPWMDARQLSFRHRYDDSDGEVGDPVDEFWRSLRFEIAAPEVIVEEVTSHMSLTLAKRWFEPWFVPSFMSDDDFGECHPPRKRGNGAKQLLKDDAYMWAPDNFEDQKEPFERFFRSECLIRATKLFLLGPSSLEADKRAASAASGGLRLLGGFKGAS